MLADEVLGDVGAKRLCDQDDFLHFLNPARELLIPVESHKTGSGTVPEGEVYGSI